MQIVIDIDDEDYKRIHDISDVFNSLTSRMYSAIKTGTPLPKGHGRLIDADAFITTMEDTSKRHEYKELLIDKYLTVDDVFKAIIESLQNKGLAEGDSPTIIEADKAENENNEDIPMEYFESGGI